MNFERLDERLRGVAGSALVPTLLAAIVHYPILFDYFKHDDFIHLYQIANHGFLEFLLTPHGGHLLAASNFVFYVLFQLFGLHAEAYHGVALATHLLNVVLLYSVMRGFTGSRGLAFFGATLWGMAPIARGSIGWFSVYGHVLATSFLLWVLVEVSHQKSSASPVSGRRLLRWYALLLAASVSFGVGLGVAACFGAVVFALLPETPNRVKVSIVLSTLVVVLPGLFLLQHELFDRFFGGLVADGRFVVLQLYRVPELLAMFAQLLGFATTSLALGLSIRGDHGNRLLPMFEGHEAALQGLTLSLLVALAALVLVALWRGRAGRSSIVGFGIMALAAYGVIAAGRVGLMDHAPSTLWMVSSPRYHYLGTLGISLLLVSSLACLARVWPGSRRFGQRYGGVLLATWLVLALPFDVQMAKAATSDAGAKARSQHRRLVSFYRRVIANKPEGAPVFFDNQRFKPVPNLGLDRFPGAAAAFVFSFPENTVDGRRVYFIEKHRDVLYAAKARAGTRIAELIAGRHQKAAIREAARQAREGAGAATSESEGH